MLSKIVKYGSLFVFLLLFQVLILNNLHMSIWLNPYVYILLIILLPFETPNWLVLTISFVVGMIIDTFSNSMGMHTAACVLLGFSRQYILKLFAPRDGYEHGHYPHYSYMGIVWFLVFAGILTFTHHITLFLIEDFRLAYLATSIPKAFFSSILSISIMLTLMLFSYKRR